MKTEKCEILKNINIYIIYTGHYKNIIIKNYKFFDKR